ncbi:MAG: hypothetical protein RMJ17_01675 [Candidatus Aenigmarchaeota archaeon]|nr:hypothetical protein [Candidatus Aenigmarchaeota archaeon]MDW8149286.1 hypothetical protein [Candidatus Aenigmarchaeota archaeon]
MRRGKKTSNESKAKLTPESYQKYFEAFELEMEAERKIELKRFAANPILKPIPENYWECFETFNAGAIVLDKKVHLFYRAVGNDWTSRIGYASSKDGFLIDCREKRPVLEYPCEENIEECKVKSSPGLNFYGIEDPRVTRVENEEKVYLTFTTLTPTALRIGLTSIPVKSILKKSWDFSKIKLISLPNVNNKNWVIFPEKINGKYVILTKISPIITLKYLDSIDKIEYIESDGIVNGTGFVDWSKRLKGAGAPPIKTEDGWLLFFHALNKKGLYSIGACLLECKDPTIVNYVSKAPVLEPKEKYETSGIKPNIVYSCGAVIKNDLLLVYYGASDTTLCVAYSYLDEFLSKLTS